MKPWLLLLALAGPAHAADTAPAGSPDTPVTTTYRVGDATRAWFALQVSGAAASPLPARSEQAVRAYQRYQKSFDTPMPTVDVNSVRTSGMK
ncbi:DUF3613 domain-containing protein [Jeongeupia sp. USM3]|uniref:DUF3613 domain-containing protein n=1 Tax=Jeongeupia sp. USM3 TaxID=1906741 RepID=UPI00089DFC70|nr:DUF3613 domain-containing protein [Jeongeupia sp. USM3]AOY01200.1 hypothetical protein BJP62_12555 [Jeongeupia sp. USM3]